MMGTLAQINRDRAARKRAEKQTAVRKSKSSTKEIGPDRTIDIRITGPKASGKSTAADIIANSLRSSGYDVEIKDESVFPVVTMSPGNKFLAKITVVADKDKQRKSRR